MNRHSLTYPLMYMAALVALTLFWFMSDGFEEDVRFLAMLFIIITPVFLITILGEIVDQLLELNQHLHRSQTKSTSTDVPSSG